MYETLVAINHFGMKFHLKQFMKPELKIHAWIVRLNNWIKVFLRFKLCNNQQAFMAPPPNLYIQTILDLFYSGTVNFFGLNFLFKRVSENLVISILIQFVYVRKTLVLNKIFQTRASKISSLSYKLKVGRSGRRG